MNLIFARSRLTAAAILCGMALASCDSIRDVRDPPSTELPDQLVVLGGTVYGLGIRRSMVVQNGTATRNVQGQLGELIGPRGRETQFSFGALLDGTAYNVTLDPNLVPFGKICVVNNGTGTLQYDGSDTFKGAPQDIEVVCQDDPAVVRYDIRVAVPEPFRSAPGARVTLLTEEGFYEADPQDPADGDPEYVWFRDSLLQLPAAGVFPFQNVVQATTETGSTPSLLQVNRCAVANHTFPSPSETMGADVENVTVGDCTFSVGGTDTTAAGAVRYSLPVGVTTAPAMGAGGLVLELTYPNGDPVPSAGGPTTEVTITSFASNFTFPTEVTSGAECPLPRAGVDPIACVVRGFYEVAVRQQPAGQRCIVASNVVGLMGRLFPGNPTTGFTANNQTNTNWGPAANLYILDESIGTGTFPTNPSDNTRLRVYCRNLPAPDRVLTGSYQVKNMITYSGSGSTVTGQLGWSPAYTARREYSHLLTFLPDGTFLFGAHNSSDTVNTVNVANHTEYGFYDYDPNNVIGTAGGPTTGPKLRFTVHIDNNVSGVTTPLASGLSAVEGPRNVGTGAAAVRHQAMTNLVFGTSPDNTRTLSGRFGPDASGSVATQRDVEFVEPASISGQLTGSWAAQDNMGAFSFSSDTNVIYHTGVNGYPNIQDTCAKIEDHTVSTGVIVGSTGGGTVACSPVGSSFQSNLSSLAHYPTNALQIYLPGWKGFFPGTDLGGGSSSRSPSPVHFHIAPAANFAASANPGIFDPASIGSTAWCPTEIVGIRDTLNGVLLPDLKPKYYCRNNY